jgi:arginine decarboxylase
MAQSHLDEFGADAALDITVRTGSGAGKTPIAAFDAALLEAGVGNLNLIHLSSVIPRASRIRRASEKLDGLHGDRLYCVYAEAHAENPGETVWAGLGWSRDATGDGLFVEHVGGNRETVIEQIHLSLSDMSANRGGGYAPPEYAVASAHWDDRPACALVLAAYQVQPWSLR